MSAVEYRGPFGRTHRVTVNVANAQGDHFTSPVVSQLNVSTDPQLKEALLNGTLNAVKDPDTGDVYTLAVPVLYHDPALKVFLLVIPDALRHRVVACRRDVLEAMIAENRPMPAYIQNFQVALGVAGLEASLARTADKPGTVSAGVDDDREEKLRAQEIRLREEKLELDTLRANLEALKLELTRQYDRIAEQSEGPDEAQATTRVVTNPLNAKAAKTTQTTTTDDDGWDVDDAPLDTVLPAAHESSGVQPRFDTKLAGSRQWYHAMSQGVLTLSYRLPTERMHRFQSERNRIYLQFHDLEEFPLVCIMVASTNEDGELNDDIYWPLDVRKEQDKNVLRRLSGNFEFRIALYNEGLDLNQVLSFKEPLELNALHLLGIAERRLQNTDDLSWNEALRRLEAPDYKRLGDMRHNFKHDSFKALNTPSEVRLATSIVGYWSGPELFRYLIENLSFSLGSFAAIQERVVTEAVKYGLALSPELRQLGLEMKLADSEATLCRTLIGTWSELCVGLSADKNDLDEVEIGLVWQEHLENAEALEENLDDDIVTMATGAIKRAQEHQEEDLWGDDDPPTNERSMVEDDVDKDRLQGLSTEDLVKRLDDDTDRLAAAAILLDRGETDAVQTIMEAADNMSEEELEIFSEHLVSAAPRVEDALIEALAIDSGTVMWLCGYALASIPSAKALPILLELIATPAHSKNSALYAETLITYGDGLLDQLLPKLADQGNELEASHPLMLLLKEYIEVGGESALDRTRQTAPNAATLIDN